MWHQIGRRFNSKNDPVTDTFKFCLNYIRFQISMTLTVSCTKGRSVRNCTCEGRKSPGKFQTRDLIFFCVRLDLSPLRAFMNLYQVIFVNVAVPVNVEIIENGLEILHKVRIYFLQ